MASVGAAASELGDRLVDHLAAGGKEIPADWLDRLAAAEDANRRRAFASQVLANAEQVAWQRLMAVGAESGDLIIEGHLAPAFMETMEETRRAADKLGTLDVADSAARLRAPKAEAEAALRLDDLRIRYTAILEARRRVWAIAGGPVEDTGGLLDVVRNMTTIWPAWRGKNLTTARPWPTDSPAAYLLWLATPPRVAWLPTPAAQDAEFLAVTADARKASLRNMQSVAMRV